MKLSLVALSVILVVPSLAHAEEAVVTCVSGQFADHVEEGRPAGDAKGIAAAHKAVYWIDVANTGEPAQVTIVWKVDGKEVQRQSLDIGRSAHWHTWGARPIGNAKTVDVQVLDASGKSLKEDSLVLAE